MECFLTTFWVLHMRLLLTLPHLERIGVFQGFKEDTGIHIQLMVDHEMVCNRSGSKKFPTCPHPNNDPDLQFQIVVPVSTGTPICLKAKNIDAGLHTRFHDLQKYRSMPKCEKRSNNLDTSKQSAYLLC